MGRLHTLQRGANFLLIHTDECVTRSDTVWRRGVVVSGVRRMNEANAGRARLVPGWVPVFGRAYHLSM